MQSTLSPDVGEWIDFPMGPRLRGYLGISEAEYRGAEAGHPSPERGDAFQAYLDEFMQRQAVEDQAEFVDLLEELTAMGLSASALALAERFPQFSIEGDFRACLALGSALMMESELDEAVQFLVQAQATVPQEIAPYVNLSAIYFALERDSDSMYWADRGLQIDPNNFRLWELVASIYLHEDSKTAGTRVRAKAEQLHSYAGSSLAADMIDPQDKLLKAQYLSDVFNAGAREEEFLVEYTAALGMAQQFEKIPQLVWRLEHLEKKEIHWKLYAHAAQAHLALNQEEQAAHLIKRVSQFNDVPSQVLSDLQEIYDQQTESQTAP